MLLASHLVTSVLAMLAPVFLFLIARRYFGPVESSLPALLFMSSGYFAGQISIVYVDLPAAAFATAAIYFAIRRNPWGLCGFGILASCTKMTAVPVVVAAWVWLLLGESRLLDRATMRRFLAPLLLSPLPMAGWIVGRMIVSGHMKTVGALGYHAYPSVWVGLKQWIALNIILFGEDWRFILTGLAVCGVLVHFRSLGGRREKPRDGNELLPLMLWCALLLTSGITLGIYMLMRRYFLPVLPLYYVCCYFAIRNIGRKAAMVTVAALAPLQMLLWFTPLLPFFPFDVGTTSPLQSPITLRHFSVIAAHRRAAEFVEALPGRPVVLTHEFTYELADPNLGYVTQPVQTVELSAAGPPDGFNFICVEARGPWAPARSLLPLVEQLKHRAAIGLVKVISNEECTVEVYRSSSCPRVD